MKIDIWNLSNKVCKLDFTQWGLVIEIVNIPINGPNSRKSSYIEQQIMVSAFQNHSLIEFHWNEYPNWSVFVKIPSEANVNAKLEFQQEFALEQETWRLVIKTTSSTISDVIVASYLITLIISSGIAVW